jgi:hypothetical protein
MQKTILAIIALISIPAMALAQAADAKAKAEQILKQARAAIGDEKKLKELQAISITGAQRQTFGDRQMENEIQLDLIMPDKIMQTTNGQFGTRVNTLNGDQVWNDFVPAMGAGGGFGGGGRFVVQMGGPGGQGGPGAGPGAQNPQMAEYFQLQQRRDLYLAMIGFLLAAPPVAQLQYSYLGEAPGPEGSKLDVLEGKGASGLALRLYFDQQSHQLIGLSYKAKNMRQMGGRGPGGGPGAPGGPGGQRPQGDQGNAQGGQRQQGQRPELTPEERERRMKEFQERFEKAPEVDYRWAFADYKSVSGLNLPHRVTKIEGGTPNEEWEISKIKINPKLSPDKFVKKEKSPAGN